MLKLLIPIIAVLIQSPPTFAQRADFVAIDPPTYFWIHEAHASDSGGISLSLHFYSGWYECSNYTIPVTTGIDSRDVQIHLGPPMGPTMCLDAFGPAHGECTLRLSKGKHRLIFESDKRVDEYLLTVKDSSITLKRKAASFCRPAEEIDPPAWEKVSRDVWRYRLKE